MSKEQTLFEQLSSIDVSEQIEKKNGLSYLSWSYAHRELKKIDPDYKVEYHTFPHPDIANDQVFVPYLATPEGYLVNVSVTVNGKTESEWLPVMDFKNKGVPHGNATTDQINKAQKRCFVKAAALHGLGLYIYNGEDLPESVKEQTAKQMAEMKKKASKEEIDKLKEKINTALELSGDDATEEKLMRWLMIEDVNSVTVGNLEGYHNKLDKLILTKAPKKE